MSDQLTIKVIDSVKKRETVYKALQSDAMEMLKFHCPIRLRKFIESKRLEKTVAQKCDHIVDLSKRAQEVAEFFYEHRTVMQEDEFIKKTAPVMDEYGSYTKS